MKRLLKGAWVLITDGEKALILQNDGDAQHPDLSVRRKESRENPPDRQQSMDRPGRRRDDGPSQRSAMQETDWHELQKHRFAADIAELLYDRVHRGFRGGIVLVADPRTLGEMRGQLHQEVAEQVIAEIPKDLTGQPVDQITRRVLEYLDRAS